MKKRYHPFSSISKKFGNFFSKAVAVLIFVLAFQPSGFIKAQSNTAHETENRLKKAAAKYFDDGDFIEAYPLYSQLLSLYPRDPNYNYRFGACLLFTKADKNKAVEYLQFSVRQTTVENLAYYYLGRALHLNYKFNAAIRTYKHFEEIASSADLKKYPVRHYIEMCTSGKELLTNLHGLDVLRKKELNLSDYFEAYDMHSNGGTLLSEPDGFKTKLDKEKNVNNVIYLTPDKKEAYFSSYGSNDKNGKDIYVVKKGADGTWGTPENLGNVINTTFDEDYPVYDVPRHTLYFCSKGHNSMGGYDIFMSVYDAVTQTWSQPQNMDFPVNTPDDDILFVPDTSGQTAFFSSTRSSPQGTIDVYKIALHLHRPETVVVAGTAYQDDGKTPTLCKITVKDIKSDSVVGVYMSSSDDGKYSFNLPNGGRYNYTVEASNHKTQSQPVVMPVSQTVSTMKQDIKFDQSGNLLVNNYPTEMPKDSDYQLAFNFIKDQAKMDVNVDTNSIKALLAQSANSASNVTATSNSSAVNSTNGLPNNTSGSSGSAASSVANNNSGGNNNTPGNNGVSNSGNTSGSLADNTRLAADEEVLNDKAAKALDYASDKMEDAQQLEAGAIAKLSNSGRTNSTVSNPDSVSAALAMLHQSRISEEKGEQAYQLAAEYKNDAAAKQLEIEKNTQSNSGSGSDANGQKLSNGQQTGNSNSELSTSRISPGDLIRRQAEQVKEDSFQVAKSNDDLAQEIKGLDQKSQDFVTQAGQVPDPQQKVALLQQADDLSKSKQEKQEVIIENNTVLKQLHTEYTWLNGKARKADSTFIASANSGKNNVGPDPSVKSALQQEIDSYAAANNYGDSSMSNVSDNSGKVASGNDYNQNNSAKTYNRTGSKYHHKKGAHTNSQAGLIAANSARGSSSDNTNNGGQTIPNNNTINNQSKNNVSNSGNNSGAVSNSSNGGQNNSGNVVSNNSGAIGDNASKSSLTNTNGISGNANSGVPKTSQGNNNSGGNQNSQAANNGGGVSNANGNNNSSGGNNPSSNNNSGGNQNSQVANNGGGVSNANGINNSGGGNNPSSNNNLGGNQDAQTANNGGGVSNANGNNNSSGGNNPSSNNNSGGNQNSQVANNGGGVSNANGNNNSSGGNNPSSNNNSGGNQNSQVANNGGGVSNVNGNSNSNGGNNPSSNNNSGGNQNSQVANNGGGVSNANGNNNSSSGNNPASNNNLGGNQDAQTANNGGGGVSNVNGNNNSGGGNNPSSSNNSGGNQNSQTPNNGGGVSNVNGNSNSSGGNNPSSNNNSGGNQNSQVANNGGGVSNANGNNNPASNNNSGGNQNTQTANNNGGGVSNVNGNNNSSAGNPSSNSNSVSNPNLQSSANGNNSLGVNGDNGSSSGNSVASGNQNNQTGSAKSGNGSNGINNTKRNPGSNNQGNSASSNATNGSAGLNSSGNNAQNAANYNTGSGSSNQNSSNSNGSTVIASNNNSLQQNNPNTKHNQSSGNNKANSQPANNANGKNTSLNTAVVSSGDNSAKSGNNLNVVPNEKDSGSYDSIVYIKPASNVPASFGYRKSNTPHDALLDSLADAVPKPKASDSRSSKRAKKNEVANTVSTVQYTDTVAAGLNQRSQNYFTAAASLVENAEKTRSKAQGESDKNKSEVLYNKADSLDDLIFQLNLKGDETLAEANYRQYYTNSNQIASISIKPDKALAYKVSAAKRLIHDADNSYRKSMSERDRANTSRVLATKHTFIKSARQDLATAILRQQSAVYMYFQVDSDQTATTMGRSTSDSNLHFTYSGFLKAKATGKRIAIARNKAGNNNPVSADTSSEKVIVENNSSVPVAATNPNNALPVNSENTNTTNTNTTKNSKPVRRTKGRKNKRNDTASFANGTTLQPPGNGASPDNSIKSSSIPENAAETGNIFRELRRSPYSSANPIPIDPPLPMGLIFKVQIGAFRNPIPQNLFKGFEPIIGLTAPEGFIRYSAGLFKTIDPAKDALQKIKNIGYPDAFIIAFYDGKRISIAEAYAKLGITPPPIVNSTNGQTFADSVAKSSSNIKTPIENNNVAANKKGKRKHARNNENASTEVNSPVGNNVASSGGNKVVVIGKNTIKPTKKAIINGRKRANRSIKDTVPPSAKPIRDVKGLVYTVQVGSFPKHKDFVRLRNMKKLYSSADENGAIKYNCGIYGSMSDARAAKDIILANTSVKDAFVSAYYNGKRISLIKAADLLSKGVEPAATSQPESPVAKANIAEAKNNDNNSTPPSDNLPRTTTVSVSPPVNKNNSDLGAENASFEEASKNNVIYTVQIGSYSDELPVDVANKILANANEGIEPHQEKHGVVTYYAGKFKDLEQANTLQQKLYAEGFQQAFIAAYYHGKKISLQEAQSINNK